MTIRPIFAVAALLGPLLVGAVLLLAGLAKALEPPSFVRHLRNLRLLQEKALLPAAVVLVALQWGLGAALMLRLWPAWILPAAILMLLALAVAGYWGTATGRTADCGCYNGVITLSPLQSLLLDVGYIALLAFSWRWETAGTPVPGLWRIAAALLATAGGGLATYAFFRYSVRHGKPLIELTPLKVGRRWNPRWLGEDLGSSEAGGEKIVAFLGASCPHCMSWVKVLNAVHGLDGLPEVQGVVALPADRLPGYVSRAEVRFPVVAVRPWQAVRLSRGVTPTAVVVKDGKIAEKWVRAMPKTFTDRLRSARNRLSGATPLPAEGAKVRDGLPTADLEGSMREKTPPAAWGVGPS
jgi:hypothetical protein